MTLIKCSGKEVSDKAKTCPNCGKKYKKKIKKKKLALILSIFVICGIVLILYFINSKKSIIGKWEQRLITTANNGEFIVNESYSFIEFYKNKKFVYYENNELIASGNYEKENDHYKLDYFGLNIFIKNEKLCSNIENCELYFVKENSKISNKITIDNGLTNYIAFNEFQTLLNEKKKSLIVLIQNECNLCEDYILELKKLNNFNEIYYYLIDDEMNEFITTNNLIFQGTPTTLLIENGKILNSISGALEYNEIVSILKKYNFNY